MPDESVRAGLEELHERQGAEWGVDQGARIAVSYGDPEAEAAALRQGCAVWDGSACGRIEMLGEDRHRFLNGLITAEVLEMTPGTSCYGLFTTIKGRVLADVLVIALPDRIWLRLPAGRGEAIAEHMSRYIITDRVELRALGGEIPIVLAGPKATESLAGWLDGGALPTEPGAHAELSVLGIEARVLREVHGGPAAFSLWLAPAAAAELVTELLESTGPPVLIGQQAVETVRVEAGIPRFGVDFDEETFPQEAGLDAAVSYEKGCYLGQEVVARIHFRGGVNRILRGLEIQDGGAAEPGNRLVSGGQEVGRVTSAVGSAAERALGYLTTAAAEPGGRVELDNGSSARVVALPFGSS